MDEPIFERDKNVKVFWTDGGTLLARARMSDTAHTIEADVEFTYPGLEITGIEGRFVRQPHPECGMALKQLEEAKGLRIEKGLIQTLEDTIGGPHGCIHMTNLVLEACFAALQGSFEKGKQVIEKSLSPMPETREERIKIFLKFRPQTRNACVVFSDESPLMKKIEELK